MPTPQNLLVEAAALNPSSIVDLFQLDMTKVGGPVLYFYGGTRAGNQDVRYGGIDYAAWPVQTQGFEWTTTGTQPRPTISFSNVLGTFTQLNLQFDGLAGCKLSRIRTFSRFLDGQAYADATAYFPIESWVINRKTDENRITCTYELANPMDFEDLMLPRRRILADQCQWDYRGNGCGYGGLNLADANDAPLPYLNQPPPGTPPTYAVVKGVTVLVGFAFFGPYNPAQHYWYGNVVSVIFPDAPQVFICIYPNGPVFGLAAPPEIASSNFWVRDTCSLRLSGCKFRFGAGGQLPFGSFPGTRETPIDPPP